MSCPHATKEALANALVGFVGVECGVDLYQFSKEELRRAKSEASVQQVLLNAPVAQGKFVCISVQSEHRISVVQSMHGTACMQAKATRASGGWRLSLVWRMPSETASPLLWSMQAPLSVRGCTSWRAPAPQGRGKRNYAGGRL